MANLTIELARSRDEIRKIAESHGLDFYETIFELVDHEELNEIAAFGGFPTRYPYWRYGMEYEQLGKSYKYGLSKIYEMVINNNPAYAYLMKSNDLVSQKLVMAHVYGHVDFFKNNFWFSHTNRKMVDQMANHGTRIRRYIEAYGLEPVESFLDTCLSLDNLIDRYSPYFSKATEVSEEKKEGENRQDVPRLKSKGYMDRFINPPEYLEEQRKAQVVQKEKDKKFPPEPAKDVLLFLLEFAPLERWERDILDIVRSEAYYFAPQAMSKIMNEGWATFWHSRMMTGNILKDDEVIDYADHHSGTLFSSPGRLNPYKLGVELWRDIEDRWNKGKFGREYEQCDDAEIRNRWDTGLGEGKKKIFEVRRIYNDITFIEEFVTEEFAEAQKLFVYKFNPRTGRPEVADRNWKLVKDQLLARLTNFGQPFITVENANHKNRGELYLSHRWEGMDLQFDHAMDTLKNLYRLWKRPVHIESKEEGKGRLLSYDGKETSIKEIGN